MMAAAVARPTGGDRLALRHRLLRETWQRIELAHDADDRPATSIARDECRRDVGDSALDVEPCATELRLEQRAALLLFISQLGERPDLFGDVGVDVAPCIERAQHLVHRLTACLDGLRTEVRCQHERDDGRGFHHGYALSSTTAIPCPTPMHIVHSAYRFFVRCSS